MSPEEIIDHAIERYERPLISHARAITGDIDSARDAVQETFLRLSKQDIRALQPRLAPWLFFVCRNCALDHRRKIIHFADAPPDTDPPSEQPTPAAAAAATEDSQLLRSLVSQLPEQQRTLLQLKFEAGLSYKEMSETLRISVSHVGVELHNAIQTLRQLWKRANTGAMP